MVGRGGFLLLEITFAMVLLLAAGTAVLASLQAYALQARTAYEERVAREAAVAGLERLEASGLESLGEGAHVLEVDLPGWENLESARCEARVDAPRDGARSVTVDVSWMGLRGLCRVSVRTLAGGGP